MIKVSEELTIVIVTSPSLSNPATSLINTTIGSFELISGLESCNIIIVFDGYKISKKNSMKKGLITMEMKDSYEMYIEALQSELVGPKYSFIRCEDHHGFAFAVRRGLEACPTKYALVAQHDRVFTNSFSRLQDLLHTFARHPHIRYIGFPTSGNIHHSKTLCTNYRLSCLNQRDIKLHLGQDLYLQPLIFWFDSQHLCHVARYLEIFHPYRNMSVKLHAAVGREGMRNLLLRKGDFIEDRFGQIQRSTLSRLGYADQTATARELFHWFGSYLCWLSSSAHPYDPEFSHEQSDTRVMVTHLKGRQLDPKTLVRFGQFLLPDASTTGTSTAGERGESSGDSGVGFARNTRHLFKLQMLRDALEGAAEKGVIPTEESSKVLEV